MSVATKENHTVCAACKQEKFNGLFTRSELSRRFYRMCMICAREKGKMSTVAVIGRALPQKNSYGRNYPARNLSEHHAETKALL